jgi:hypothetical protein
MSDDWRVELDVVGHGGVRHLRERARERAVARDARQRLGGDVVVTVDDDRLYAYADSEARAQEAEARLRELAAEHGLEASATITRWHPEEQRWEPIGAGMPSTPAEHAAEQRALENQQATETAQRRYAEWEVRIELPDREAAQALAARLQSESVSTVCRSRHVVIATATEAEAHALAERMRAELPEAVSVTAEGSAAVAMDELNPLSVITGRWKRI